MSEKSTATLYPQIPWLVMQRELFYWIFPGTTMMSPSSWSWNIYGKFRLFVQTTEVSWFRPLSSPSSAFIFFIRHLGLHAQLKLCKLPHPPVKGVSIFSTGILPMLAVDWDSWPVPLFRSILIQTLRNTNFLCNQCNWKISQGIYSTDLY